MNSTTRPACALLLGVTLCLTSSTSCVTRVNQNPLRGSQFWQRYAGLENVRAAAIAGDPEGVWVGGAASGAASAEEAEREAIAECNRQRRHRRLQDQCVLYAVGDELVQPDPEPDSEE